MKKFQTMTLPEKMDACAPDGSEVRLLPTLEGRGGIAHFALPAGQVSKAVMHRTVEEIWYFLTGRGQMWREQGGHSEIVDVHPGVALTIPLGTRFQFRSDGPEPLAAIGVTMPPWPGEGEGIMVDGIWEPNVPA